MLMRRNITFLPTPKNTLSCLEQHKAKHANLSRNDSAKLSKNIIDEGSRNYLTSYEI